MWSAIGKKEMLVDEQRVKIDMNHSIVHQPTGMYLRSTFPVRQYVRRDLWTMVRVDRARTVSPILIFFFFSHISRIIIIIIILHCHDDQHEICCLHITISDQSDEMSVTC